MASTAVTVEMIEPHQYVTPYCINQHTTRDTAGVTTKSPPPILSSSPPSSIGKSVSDADHSNNDDVMDQKNPLVDHQQ